MYYSAWVRGYNDGFDGWWDNPYYYRSQLWWEYEAGFDSGEDDFYYWYW